jgi:phosphate starvation-inducible PhoH-like protein
MRPPIPHSNIQERMVFEDNRLVPVLYGEQNAHLRKIEATLHVEIGNRGNELVITGDPRQTEKARLVLEALWGRLQRGLDVDTGEVDAALRFLSEHKKTGLGKDDHNNIEGFSANEAHITTRKRKIIARTPQQGEYIRTMKSKQLAFGLGPAGTGKTYLAVARAVEMMEAGKVERIILSRPAVEAGERIGFLPGGMEEKMDPYMRPLWDALHDTMAGDRVEKKIIATEIEIAPLAFMRGRTLNNAFVILDEAQNTTTMQMLMFLTRLGENSFMVITGDPTQIDLPKGTQSGLLEAIEILKNVEDIGFVRFTSKDVVRSRMVEKIVQAYEQNKKS